MARATSTVERTITGGKQLWELSGLNRLRLLCFTVLSHRLFDPVIGVVIIWNSVTIGQETNARLSGEDTELYENLEHFFMGVYAVELLMRFLVLGPAMWSRCIAGSDRLRSSVRLRGPAATGVPPSTAIPSGLPEIKPKGPVAEPEDADGDCATPKRFFSCSSLSASLVACMRPECLGASPLAN